MYSSRPIDASRIEHAQRRQQAIVERYILEHPDGVFSIKVRDGSLPLEQAYALLDEMARDPKTGMNRSDLLHLALAYEIDGAGRHGWPLSVIVADVDDFRSINHELTHLGADEVLREIANLLHEGIRQSDDILAGDERVVRWGGEEFVIILVGANHAAASLVAERLRASIARSFVGRRSQGGTITASFGVSEWQANVTPTWSELIRAADLQLSVAKVSGKNRVA